MQNLLKNQRDMLLRVTGREDVSRETIENLNEFSALLLKWNNKINLVSKKIDKDELWSRHILDSAQLIKYIPQNKHKILDLGSGAGFPGIIISIISGFDVTLLESDERKCAFMQEIISKFKLNAKVLIGRIELAGDLDVDVVTSRALASLNKLLEYSIRFIRKDNLMLFLKGQNVVEEINEASICWGFDYKMHQGALNNEGKILEISNLRRL